MKQEGDDWLSDCRVWLYKGAWEEWDIEEIDQTKQVINDLIEHISDKNPHSSQAGLRLAVLARSKDVLKKVSSIYRDVPILSNFSGNVRFEHRATKEFLRTIYFLQTGSVNLYQANKVYEKYYQVQDDSYAEDMRQEISKKILHLAEFEEHLYRKQLFILMKDVRSVIHDKYNLSDLVSGDLSTNLIELFPNAEEALEDCRTFLSNNSSVTLEEMFEEEKASNTITVKASNGKRVLVNFSTIHGVKGETYDGVLYFSKDRTSICSQQCPLNANNKRSVKWAEVIAHDVSTCESKRLVYVALSRASQTLWIAAESEIREAFSNLLRARS